MVVTILKIRRDCCPSKTTVSDIWTQGENYLCQVWKKAFLQTKLDIMYLDLSTKNAKALKNEFAA